MTLVAAGVMLDWYPYLSEKFSGQCWKLIAAGRLLYSWCQRCVVVFERIEFVLIINIICIYTSWIKAFFERHFTKKKTKTGPKNTKQKQTNQQERILYLLYLLRVTVKVNVANCYCGSCLGKHI